VVSELSGGKLDEFDAAKMLDTLSLSPENDLSGVRAYKKLLEAVDKRSDTIGRLKFEIQLNEKRRSPFDLLRPKKELVEVKTYQLAHTHKYCIYMYVSVCVCICKCRAVIKA
jgi:sentrin-specific protease 1